MRSFTVLRRPSLSWDTFRCSSPLESTDRIRLLSPACPCQTPPTRPRLFFLLERDMLLSLMHPPSGPSLHLSEINARSKVPAGPDFFDHFSACAEAKFHSAVCGISALCAPSVWGCDPAGLPVCWPRADRAHCSHISLRGDMWQDGLCRFCPRLGYGVLVMSFATRV